MTTEGEAARWVVSHGIVRPEAHWLQALQVNPLACNDLRLSIRQPRSTLVKSPYNCWSPKNQFDRAPRPKAVQG